MPTSWMADLAGLGPAGAPRFLVVDRLQRLGQGLVELGIAVAAAISPAPMPVSLLKVASSERRVEEVSPVPEPQPTR